MLNLFAILPLLLLILSSYYFNNKKLSDTKSEIVFISILEGTLSYFVIVILFLQGFLSVFFLFVITLVLMFTFAYFVFFKDEYNDDDWDLQIETVKNNLVLFTIIVLPLYVFLTIFRYLEPYYQIPLAVLLTASIFYLSILARKLLDPLYNKISFIVSMMGNIKYFYLWVIIGVVFSSAILFQFPKNTVSESLNLSNNVKYLAFDGFPTNIQNNFHQEEVSQVDSEYLFSSKITDYYYDSTHLYIYTSSNLLLIYNLTTKEIVFEEKFDSSNTTINSFSEDELYNRFIYFDNQLFLQGIHYTYLLTPSAATEISDVSSNSSRYYMLDDELYFLKKTSDTIFETYKYSAGAITLNETIDLGTTTYDNLLVISQNYFYEENNKYILHEDPTITFNIEEGFPIYDQDNHIMYYNSIFIDETIYSKVASGEETDSFTLYKSHNLNGIVIDDYIFFTSDLETSKNRIEIMNNRFEIEAIYNHQELQPFWISNEIHESYIGNYQEKDNNIEFVQIDQNDKHTVITVYQLIEKEVYIAFPFYSFYGIGIFVSITIAFFIPLSNYRESITYSSFETVTEGKKTKS